MADTGSYWRPTVTVVVPAYQAERHIGRCLRSLDLQDYPEQLLTIIVVDDGSTDSTSEVVRSVAPAAILLSQANAGPAAARNKGASHATSEILLFTDSDCEPAEDWVSRMVGPFANSSVMAVKGAYRNTQTELLARFCQVEFEERFARLRRFDSIDMVDAYSAGYRTALFKELGGFDTRFPYPNNEDTELSYRMATLGYRMVFEPAAFVTHLDHPATLAQYAKLKFGRGYWRMLIYKLYPGKAIRDTYTPISLKIQVMLVVLMLPLLPVAIISPSSGLAVIAVLISLFLASTISFLAFAFPRDTGVAVTAPFLLFWRALAIGLGVMWGSIHARFPTT